MEDVHAGLIMKAETFRMGGKHRDSGALREMQLSDDFNAFWGGDSSAVFVRNGFTEGTFGYPKGTKWHWGMMRAGNRCPHHYDGHRYFGRDFAARLLRSAPVLFAYGWQDCHLVLGMQDRLRRIAVPYRSIPLGRYRDLKGKGLDHNIAVRETRSSGRHALYVVNRGWWDVDVTLTLSGEAKVNDLVLDRESVGRAVTFKLSSFDIKVFEIDSPGVEIVSAETRVPLDVTKYVVALFTQVKTQLGVMGEQDFERLDTNLTYAQARARLAAAEAAFAVGDTAGVMDVLNSFAFMRVRKYLSDTPTRELKPRASYRVDCGSSKPYMDSKGRVWLPDQDYSYGASLYGVTGGGVVDRPAERPDMTITGTPDPRLYEAERYGLDKYCFRVPNGTYEVRLHFAETWKPRDTSIDVAIEGARVLSGLNIIKEAGFDKPLVKTFPRLAVDDGELTIGFSGRGKKISETDTGGRGSESAQAGVRPAWTTGEGIKGLTGV